MDRIWHKQKLLNIETFKICYPYTSLLINIIYTLNFKINSINDTPTLRRGDDNKCPHVVL